MQFAKKFIPNQYVFILAVTISQEKKVLHSRLHNFRLSKKNYLHKIQKFCLTYDGEQTVYW